MSGTDVASITLRARWAEPDCTSFPREGLVPVLRRTPGSLPKRAGEPRWSIPPPPPPPASHAFSSSPSSEPPTAKYDVATLRETVKDNHDHRLLRRLRSAENSDHPQAVAARRRAMDTLQQRYSTASSALDKLTPWGVGHWSAMPEIDTSGFKLKLGASLVTPAITELVRNYGSSTWTVSVPPFSGSLPSSHSSATREEFSAMSPISSGGLLLPSLPTQPLVTTPGRVSVELGTELCYARGLNTRTPTDTNSGSITSSFHGSMCDLVPPTILHFQASLPCRVAVPRLRLEAIRENNCQPGAGQTRAIPQLDTRSTIVDRGFIACASNCGSIVHGLVPTVCPIRAGLAQERLPPAFPVGCKPLESHLEILSRLHVTEADEAQGKENVHRWRPQSQQKLCDPSDCKSLERDLKNPFDELNFDQLRTFSTFSSKTRSSTHPFRGVRGKNGSPHLSKLGHAGTRSDCWLNWSPRSID